MKKNKKKPVSSAQDKNSLFLFYLSVIFGYSIGIPVAFSSIGNISFFSPYLSIIGFIISLSGLWIRWSAIRTLNQHFNYHITFVEGHQLVETGLYRIIRHPSYIGQTLIFIGCGLAFANWITLLLFFFPHFSVILYRIHVEEKALAGYFKEKYKEYQKRTFRLIPWIY